MPGSWRRGRVYTEVDQGSVAGALTPNQASMRAKTAQHDADVNSFGSVPVAVNES
jgi:hypothetical protein